MDRESRRRWLVLFVGLVAFVAACVAQYGLPYLLPAFRAGGLTLTQAGIVVSAPVAGVLCSLVAWGMVTDRFGERWVLAAGMAAAALALAGAARSHRLVVVAGMLFVAGAASACAQVASGRLIMGWFPVRERGLAMGLRQTGQPIGVGIAALVLPVLGGHDIDDALAFLAGGCALAAVLVAVVVRDPSRPPRSGPANASPYRGSYLWKVHLASALLVVPQFTVAVFAFDYLVTGRGWSPGTAGPLLAGAQVGGAAIRLLAGWWSDRAGSRIGPMRRLCVATGAVLLLLAAGAASGSAVAVLGVVLASVLTVSTNGLAFTAVAERAGGSWAGRAMGIQSTGQNLFAAATPPLVAGVISASGPVSGYPAAFGGIVVLPLLAALVLPRGDT
jgi:MFS family permease